MGRSLYTEESSSAQSRVSNTSTVQDTATTSAHSNFDNKIDHSHPETYSKASQPESIEISCKSCTSAHSNFDNTANHSHAETYSKASQPESTNISWKLSAQQSKNPWRKSWTPTTSASAAGLGFSKFEQVTHDGQEDEQASKQTAAEWCAAWVKSPDVQAYLKEKREQAAKDLAVDLCAYLKTEH